MAGVLFDLGSVPRPALLNRDVILLESPKPVIEDGADSGLSGVAYLTGVG